MYVYIYIYIYIYAYAYICKNMEARTEWSMITGMRAWRNTCMTVAVNMQNKLPDAYLGT